eukprot:4097555-Amphidinium_carterae.1
MWPGRGQPSCQASASAKSLYVFQHTSTKRNAARLRLLYESGMWLKVFIQIAKLALMTGRTRTTIVLQILTMPTTLQAREIFSNHK